MLSDGSFDPGEHSLGQVRRSLLERLAAELRGRGRRALIALSNTDHPVLYVERDGGGMVAVVAAQVEGSWSFLWGKRGQSAADSIEMTAYVLSGFSGARHRLSASRPRPRGAFQAVA